MGQIEMSQLNSEIYEGSKFREMAINGEPLKGELVIDAHTHLGYFNHYHIPDSDIPSVVREMDRTGVNHACTFAFAGVNSDFVYGNDVTAEAMRLFPDRFTGFTVVNPHYPHEMVPELERCHKLGFRGIKLIAAYQDYPAEGPAFIPACGYAHENGLFMLNHYWGSPEHLDHLARTYSRACFIIGHFSIDYAEVVKRRSNVYQCTCAALMYNDIEKTASCMPDEKIVYGSDFTDLPIMFSMGPVLFARISDESKRRILGLNMERLLDEW